jgi:uncharacterized membrane protein YbhN (UPF0104 family)
MKPSSIHIFAKVVLSIGISMLLLGGLSHLVFHSSGQAMVPRLLALLRQVSLALVAAYAVTAVAQGVLRAWRYRILIGAGGVDTPPGLRHMILVTMVRNMLVDMLPARLGEISYIAMLNRGYRITAGSCVSSLAISVVFDVLSLLVFFTVLVAGQLMFRQLEMQALGVLALLAVLGLVMIALVFKAIPLISNWLSRWSSWTRGRLTGRLLAFIDNTAKTVDNTRRAGILTVTLLLSMGIRLVKYGALYLLFTALAMAMAADVSTLTPISVLSGLVSAEAAAGVPMPTFLGFGTYETGGMLALGLLGVSKTDALLLFLGLHIITQSVDYLLGGAAMVGLAFFSPRWRRPAAPSHQTPIGGRKSAWLLTATITTALAGALFMGYQLHKTRKLGRLQPPASGQALPSATANRSLPSGFSHLQGFVVWSSNRFGNHDIVMAALPEMTLTRLTHHPHVDYFPRISPDGSRIAFSRSTIEWVSQRNYIPWDVVVLDLASGQETVVARNGNTPTWSEDGRRLYFQRDGNRFVALDLATGQEREVYRTGNPQLADSVMLETPVYSDPAQSTAVTLRGSLRAVVLISGASEVRYLGQGCQLNWGPGGGYLYQVDKGGRQQNAVFRRDRLDDFKPRLWLDLPGDHSHEYFPKVGNHGRYLVLGASTGGHEHDSADYEIFLWRIGSAPEATARLTHHTGNDCWPDLYLESDPDPSAP